MTQKHHLISLIDPVGIKAGMDHYDLLLLSGIQNENYNVELYSNFTLNNHKVKTNQVFFNTGVSKIKSITSNFLGFIRALRSCKKNQSDWIIVHIFRAGIFDLVVFSIAKIWGFKLCAIIHDIESLDTYSIEIVRKTVIRKIPDIRVVHNEFSKNELIKTMGVSIDNSTFVIPHVNFHHLFNHYHHHPDLLENLKLSSQFPQQIHADLNNCIREKVPLFLFFGQIKKAKGLDVLLEAISQSPSNFKVIIAGKVRDENWQRYEQIITFLNIKDRVLPVIRHITDEERDYLFSISHAIILPYTRIYQSGVMLMAMSFPMPVIASDLSPNADIITSGENGILFPSENAKILAQKIQLLIENPELRNQLSQEALKSVEHRYNTKTIGKKYSELLQ